MSSLSFLSQSLVDKFTISAAAADLFVRELFGVIREQLITDKVVKVKGFGTFKIVETSARETIDVNTRERITIGAKNRIVFTPEAAVRDRINSPFAQFESVELDDDVEIEGLLDNRDDEEEPIVAETATHVAGEEVPPTKEIVSIEEDNDTEAREEEEEPVSRTAVPLRGTYISLALIAVVVLSLVGYLCYTAGMKQWFNMSSSVTATENVVKEDAPIDAATAATAQATATQTPAAAAPRTTTTKEEEAAPYDSDPRVRLGAYDIVGLDTTVTVHAQQTLAVLSRAYLGEGMQCYVEAYNGGIKSVEVGDTLRIPKVRLKKKNKTNKHTSSSDGTRATQ